jgi:uncharacterized RDD family membrane protein YckC
MNQVGRTTCPRRGLPLQIRDGSILSPAVQGVTEVDEYVCPNCGTPARGASICTGCGTDLDAYKELPRRSEFEAGGVEAVRATYAQEVRQAAGAPGGVFIRWAALFLDNLLSFGIPLLLAFLLALVRVDPAIVAGAAILVFWVFYAPLMLAFADGQTLGKKAMNVRVETRDGRPIGLARAFGRETFKVILFVFPLGLLADALVAGTNDERRSIHDRVFGTRVVTTR